MQHEAPGTITILMADDDADDRMMAADAMRESRLGNTFRCVEDGQELMDYLMRRGKYAVVAPLGGNRLFRARISAPLRAGAPNPTDGTVYRTGCD